MMLRTRPESIRRLNDIVRYLKVRVPTILIVLSVLLSTSPASAEDGEFGRPGGYISAGVSGALQAFNGDAGSIADVVDFGTALIIGGRIGYRANKFIAIEGVLDYSITGFKVEVPGAGSIEARSLVGMGNVKLYPGDWRVQPFAMGGLGVVVGATDCTLTNGTAIACSSIGLADQETVFGGRVGGGLDFYLTRNLALSGEVAYVIPTDALSEFAFLTVGGQVLIRF
jgi:opacity protein-like surface antigen